MQNRRKIFVALRMAGVAGQDKLAGVFRYLGERYGDDNTNSLKNTFKRRFHMTMRDFRKQ